MKKAIIIFACMALLICTFCIAASAEEEWNDATEKNVSNLSYIIKMIADAGYNINTDAPFESATGQITIGETGIAANSTITTTIPITDLIENFNASNYYALYFEANGMTITIGTYTFRGDGLAMGTEAKQFADTDTVTITTTQTVTTINKFMISQWTYQAYIAGTNPAWTQSADYNTGYLYASGGDESLADIMTDIIGILVAGIGSMATGIGAGLSSLVKAVFCVVDATTGAVTGLSNFGGLVVVFAGISLAVGLSRWVVNWVTSIGASH